MQRPHIQEAEVNDRPAVVSETGEAFGHAVVADRIARLASVLLQPKMAAGDVVALLSESSGASLEVVWAARQAGLVLLPLDPSLSVDEIAFVLNDSGAGVLVTSARYASVARSLEMLTPYLLARFSLDAAIDGHRQLALDRSTASPFRGEPAPAGTLHYTSSVTGRPTAYRVLEADSAELGAVLGEQAAAELGPDSVLVTACPVSDPVSVQLVTAVYAACCTRSRRTAQPWCTYRPSVRSGSPSCPVRCGPGSVQMRCRLCSSVRRAAHATC
jgi:long-chain acyl-CoA synthetase